MINENNKNCNIANKIKTKQYQFSKAINKNDIQKVKILIKHIEVSPEINKNRAIRQASENGYYEIVK